MSLSLVLALLAFQDVQGPKIDTPRALLACGTDASLESTLCRATVASEQKRYVEAATAFEEAAPLAGDAREQRARIELAAANMWLAAERPAEADLAIARALEYDLYLAPLQRGLARIDRARAALAQNNAELALQHLADAETYAAADPFLWWMKGTILLDTGDLAGARAALDTGLALAHDAPELLLLAGHVAIAEGDEAEARTKFAEAATHTGNPSAAAAAEALASMETEAQ
ncbi:hypothetical protein [Sphingomicrobium clamense]|uniref:Tetratricopeptide repeat protein n=1 Tax=Sphingomicrobium clamense TaxID=2851013 RepID=A0ABS6V3H6_9SPHN|nr:hypothetical protein [Sphingomicrobium sp. B8]MBW0144107.1 hypothetical protein [Sphingomicrobium sp. B8]